MSHTGTLLRLTDREVLLDQHVVMRGDQIVAELTPLEAQFLAYLAAHPGEVVAREVLLREVWGYAPTVHSRAIDKTVHRLRTKLEPEPTEPRHLVGVRSMGYRLTDLGFVHDPSPAEPAAEPTSGAPLPEAEAVRLLRDRAITMGADAEALAGDARALAAVAHRLDRLPDALEVAARRLVSVSPSELASALAGHDDPIEVLPGLSPLAESRWALLPLAVRDPLAWLVAFHGPFTRAQAHALPAIGDHLPDVIPVALHHRALVAMEHGMLRLGALMTGPARRRLGPDLGEAERRALEILTADATRWSAAWREGDAREPVRALGRVLPSLRRLVEAHATEAPATAARALTAMDSLMLRADPRWFGAQVERVLPLLDPHDPQVGWMHMWRARVAHNLGQVPALADLARAALIAARGDPVVVGEATVSLSSGLYWGCEDDLNYAPEIEAALLALGGHRQPMLEARLQLSLGLWYERAAQWELALAQHQHAATLLWQAGDVGLLANAIGFCMIPLAQLGRLDEARVAADLAIAAHREVGAELQTLHAMRTSAGLHQFVGEHDAARAQMLEVLDRARARGDLLAELYAHHALAFTALERGLLHEARAHAMISRELCATVGTAPVLAQVERLEGLLHIEAGESDEALAALRRVIASGNDIAIREEGPSAACLALIVCAAQGDEAGVEALHPASLRFPMPADLDAPGLYACVRPVPAALATPPGSVARALAADGLIARANAAPTNRGTTHRYIAVLLRRLAAQLRARA